ncbi:MAG: SDR family NAD(P)-dependent oxidoreductase, partial [Candidatus Omnitrophica bacterium]|nr:SDR family NAD(P)-dependent oxidoreductase [Candidatus Omnitrophota bacterium]
MKNNCILVTGGAGFIGSEFSRLLVTRGYNVVVADKLTYAGDLARLDSILSRYPKKFIFYKVDICHYKKMESIFKKCNPHIVVHFAAIGVPVARYKLIALLISSACTAL